jgi:hypothetical protein
MSTITERLRISTHTYLAVKPCGCNVAMVVDTSDRETARCVGRWIREGLAIERVTHDEARERFGRCASHRKSTT